MDEWSRCERREIQITALSLSLYFSQLRPKELTPEDPIIGRGGKYRYASSLEHDFFPLLFHVLCIILGIFFEYLKG